MEKKRAGDDFSSGSAGKMELEDDFSPGNGDEMEVEDDFFEDTDEGSEKPKKAEHYFSGKPTSEKKYGLVIAPLRGKECTFLTCSGVFSPTKIDLGTWLLVDSMQIAPDSKVLDLGCGYGVLGIVAAKLAPTGFVTMVDVNERAIELAKKNIRRNGVLNAKAKRGDLYAPVSGETFDVILSNPPFSAGMETVFSIISGGREHLNPGGSIQVVARHSKGGRRVEEMMRGAYGNCEAIGRRSGFRVYLSRLQ